MESLRRSGVEFEISPGDGAFYGPKIEYTLKDAIGRPWQCGTMQVDFSMPERLGAEYVAEDSTRKPPVMLHRAIVGCLERFIGILIEHHAGALPAWLAPVQVVVASITDGQADYAETVVEALQKQGVRARSDLRNEKITYKIREHTLQKVPFILVVGDKEKANGRWPCAPGAARTSVRCRSKPSPRRSSKTSAPRSEAAQARFIFVRAHRPCAREEAHHRYFL